MHDPEILIRPDAVRQMLDEFTEIAASLDHMARHVNAAMDEARAGDGDGFIAAGLAEGDAAAHSFRMAAAMLRDLIADTHATMDAVERVDGALAFPDAPAPAPSALGIGGVRPDMGRAAAPANLTEHDQRRLHALLDAYRQRAAAGDLTPTQRAQIAITMAQVDREVTRLRQVMAQQHAPSDESLLAAAGVTRMAPPPVKPLALLFGLYVIGQSTLQILLQAGQRAAADRALTNAINTLTWAVHGDPMSAPPSLIPIHTGGDVEPVPAPTPIPMPLPTDQRAPPEVFPQAQPTPGVVVQPGPVPQQPTPVISANPLPTPGVRGPVVSEIRSIRSVVGYKGRIEQVEATIDPADLGTGTDTNPNSRAFARRLGQSTDDAGHARGNQLGGRGGVRDGNIFPQNPHINRGIYRQLEDEVANYVRSTGASVDIRVTLQYHTPTDTRPYAVTYEALQAGAPIPEIASRSFLNPP